jgi:hypothetical protein
MGELQLDGVLIPYLPIISVDLRIQQGREYRTEAVAGLLLGRVIAEIAQPLIQAALAGLGGLSGLDVVDGAGCLAEDLKKPPPAGVQPCRRAPRPRPV